jgi:hypothetical protein
MTADRRRPRKAAPRLEPLEGRIAPGVIMGDIVSSNRAGEAKDILLTVRTAENTRCRVSSNSSMIR